MLRKLLVTASMLAAVIAMSARAEVDKKTERAWKAKCASCHAADASGDTEQGKKLGVKDYTKAEWQARKTDDQIKAGIENGVKDQMDGYKDKLDAEQIKKLVELIRSFKK